MQQCELNKGKGQDRAGQDGQDWICDGHLFIVVAISKVPFTLPIATEIKPAAQEQHCSATVGGRVICNSGPGDVVALVVAVCIYVQLYKSCQKDACGSCMHLSSKAHDQRALQVKNRHSSACVYLRLLQPLSASALATAGR